MFSLVRSDHTKKMFSMNTMIRSLNASKSQGPPRQWGESSSRLTLHKHEVRIDVEARNTQHIDRLGPKGEAAVNTVAR